MLVLYLSSLFFSLNEESGILDRNTNFKRGYMKAFLAKSFDVREGEFRIVLILSLLLLGNTVVRQMTGIVGISDLINTAGPTPTLIVNGINAVMIFITALLASLIIDRFHRVELLKWTTFGFAMVFVITNVVSLLNASKQVVAAIVYLMSQQQWLLFPMFFWVLANDIFEVVQAKRLIPVIGSWSFVGKMLGIGITLLPALLFEFGWLTTNELTLDMVIRFNILFYLVAFLVISVGLRKIQIRDLGQGDDTVQESLSEGWDFVRQVNSYRLLLLAIAAVAVCDVIIEYRFFVVAKETLTDPAGYKNFYSLYLLVAAIVSFVIQGFVTGRLIQRIQLKNTFLIQPFLALASSLAMILSPGMASTTISSWMLKLSRNTIDEATRKAYQGFVPEERRGRVALFTDNFAPAVGMLIASVLGFLIVYISEQLGFASSFYIYLGVTALFAGLAVWFIMKMRASYDDSLFNWRLKRRKRGSDVLKDLKF
jgi:ATP:ADP antiporter, AAA family